MRFLAEPSPLPGPTKLLAHIRGPGPESRSIPAWCAEKNLPRHKIEKAIKGQLEMSVPFAAEIEVATDGEVVVADWIVASAGATGTEG